MAFFCDSFSISLTIFVAAFFSDLDIDIIDTDLIARDIVAKGTPVLDEISSHFGPEIILPTGELNRSKLRGIIFNDESMKKWLEELLHPLIRKNMLQAAELSSSPYCILVIPLLFETTQSLTFVDRVLLVDATEQSQIERTKQRDDVSYGHVKQILHSQVSREERLKKSDDVITNDGDLESLKLQVQKLHNMYLNLS